MKIAITYLLILINVSYFAQQPSFLSCNKGLDGNVRALYKDTVLNKLIILGGFNYADGKSVNGAATWDGYNFDTLGSGAKYVVNGNAFSSGCVIRYKNKLYAQFSDLYLYSFDFNTQQWTKISQLFNGYIFDATIFNNELILVGQFTKVGSTTVKNIIKFNGTVFDTLTKPLFSFKINTVQVYKNELYIGGSFDALPYTAIAKYSGTNWTAVSPTTSLTGANQEVYCMEIYNNKLYVSGNWAYTNGNFQPSLATWDGQTWGTTGTLLFNGGVPSAIANLKVYKNKLYAFYGVDYIISATNPNDTVKTKNIAVWNDTIWCGIKANMNFGLSAVENYKDQWYFVTNQTAYGDTLPYFTFVVGDTTNYLGIYVGKNGKLERNCFDKIPVIETTTEPILPQLITANGDGVNDEIIIQLPNTQSATLLVFNRWGNMVYKIKDANPNTSTPQILKWDGTYNNKPLPSGTYFYVVESINLKNEQKNYRQFVEVLY